LLERAENLGVQRLVRDLNRLYRRLAALHELDFAPEGFAWIDCHDADHSVLSFRRMARDGALAIVVLNFTPVPREGYRIGVPRDGAYREVLNSDSRYYGGSDIGNAGTVHAEALPWMGLAFSLVLTLPPLAGLVLAPA
jgi:1,4-alpha-glucan branching enzyme